MITNMSEVFNSVLNSYFVAIREQGANRLASNDQHIPYVDAQIKARVVKAR